ncbi:MAG: sigma-70 family RNA polymerase sigma factor [Bacteroidia bacterium]
MDSNEKEIQTTLAKWVEHYTNELYSWAYYKTSEAMLAEDLVQETFLAAFQNFSNFQKKSSPKTWLFSILNHKIVDYYRKKETHHFSQTHSFDAFFDEKGAWTAETAPHTWGQEEDVHLLDNVEFQAVLEKCLQNLPKSAYYCVVAKYLEAKESEAICQELAISTTNFWQVMHRAKLHLRKCIEFNWFKV